MKKLFTLIICTAVLFPALGRTVDLSDLNPESTEEEIIPEKNSRPTIRVGGTLFLTTYYDSYKSVDNREGVSYMYPCAPHYGENGKDLNKVDQYAMSVYQTRLSITGDNFSLLGGDARLFVETDFMGSGNDFLQLLRIRHAYLQIKWEKDELLLGQTNNVEVAEDALSGILTSGAGNPIVILNRSPMIRYGRTLAPDLKLYVGLSFIRAQAGPVSANRNAGRPSFEAKLQYGNGTDLLVGIAGGYRALRPRTEENGWRMRSTVQSGNAAVFFRVGLGGGHTLRGQSFYGSDLSHLGMIGGYAKRAEDPIDSDYGYTNFITSSSWAEYESGFFGNFRAGLFGGYMKNLGTVKSMDPEVIYARDADLSCTGRISPRLTYHWKSLLFGLEYSYFWARWGESFDAHYKADHTFKTTENHRVLLLARFAF